MSNVYKICTDFPLAPGDIVISIYIHFHSLKRLCRSIFLKITWFSAEYRNIQIFNALADVFLI